VGFTSSGTVSGLRGHPSPFSDSRITYAEFIYHVSHSTTGSRRNRGFHSGASRDQRRPSRAAPAGLPLDGGGSEGQTITHDKLHRVRVILSYGKCECKVAVGTLEGRKFGGAKPLPGSRPIVGARTLSRG
jgi:hypothetical protein